MANLLNKLCGTNVGKDKDANDNPITTNAAGQPLPSSTVVGASGAYPIYETQRQPVNAQTSSSLGWGSSAASTTFAAAPATSSSSLAATTTSLGTSSSTTTSSSTSNLSNTNYNNIGSGSSSLSTTKQLPTVVAPSQQLPPEILPTVHKEQVLPTEVRRVQEHQQQHVVQPMVREVVQPVETVVKKPIQTEVQPVRETIVHPKVENIVHTAPSQVVQPIHETNKLQTLEQRIDKPAIDLGAKTGSMIPEPPTQVKQPLHPQAGDKVSTGFASSTTKTSESNFSKEKVSTNKAM